MAKARKILKHLKAVGNIREVTRTMEMVSRSTFRRIYDRVAGARPYTAKLTDLTSDIIARSRGDWPHPLLQENVCRKEVLLVLTSNRGLAGAYNQALLRLATERYQQLVENEYEVSLHVVGKKGVNHFRFLGYDIARTYPAFDRMPDYAAVRKITTSLVSEFLAGRIGGLEVAYQQSVSSGRYRPAIAPVLPLSHIEPPPPPPGYKLLGSYELYPSAEEVLEHLLPATVRLRVYQCFLDAAVSEQVARMTAMRTATDNADEMIHDLTVGYNRTRQSQITTELSEIMSGRTGLK